MGETSGSGCLKATGIGCGSCLVLAIVAAISVWAGWGSIREMGFLRELTSTIETAKSEAVATNELRTALIEAYPAERIEVRADIQSRNGVTVKTLVVAVVDPRAGIPDSESGKESLAREIAKRVATLHPTLDLYDQLRLTLVREGDGGARLGSTSSFQFLVAELLGETGAAHPGAASTPPASPAPTSN